MGRERNRDKGADKEREWARKLRVFFPNAKRAPGEQAQDNTTPDIKNTNYFAFEVKAGEAYTWVTANQLLEKAIRNNDNPYKLSYAVIALPDDDDIVLMYWPDFKKLLEHSPDKLIDSKLTGDLSQISTPKYFQGSHYRMKKLLDVYKQTKRQEREGEIGVAIIDQHYKTPYIVISLSNYRLLVRNILFYQQDIWI